MLNRRRYDELYAEKAMMKTKKYVTGEINCNEEGFLVALLGMCDSMKKATDLVRNGKIIPPEIVSAISYPLNVYAEQLILGQRDKGSHGHWYICVRALFMIQGPLSRDIVFELIKQSVDNPQDETSEWIKKAMERADLNWVLEE